VLYGLTNSQRLLAFDSSNPSISLGSVAISGLSTPGEKLTDIDVRVGGGLYGRSDRGLIYFINPQTGSAAQVGGFAAGGASVGIDFDPTRDQLRVVNFSGGNVAVNPTFGSIATVGAPLIYTGGDIFQGNTPHLSSLAFTNSVPFALTTQLYGIDHITDTLAVGIDDPNFGQFATVGFLGVDVTNRVGFDIDSFLNIAYVTVQRVGTSSSLFGSINLATGALSLTGPVGPTAPLILDIASAQGLAIPTPSAPTQPFPNMNPLFPPTSPLTPTSPLSPPTPAPTPLQPFPTTGTFFPGPMIPSSTPFPMTGTLFSPLVQPLAPGIFGPSIPFGSPTSTFGPTGIGGTSSIFGPMGSGSTSSIFGPMGSGSTTSIFGPMGSGSTTSIFGPMGTFP